MITSKELKRRSLSTWLWIKKNVLSMSGLTLFWKSADMFKATVIWLLIFGCMIGSIVLVWQSVIKTINSQPIDGIAAAFVAVLLLIVCLMADRYVSGPSPTGGGKNR